MNTADERDACATVDDAPRTCTTCRYQPVKGVVGLPPMCTHPLSPRDVISPYPWSCECMRANGACGHAGLLWQPRDLAMEPPQRPLLWRAMHAVVSMLHARRERERNSGA